MKNALKKYVSFCLLVAIIFLYSISYAQDDSLFRFLKKIEYPISSFTADYRY